MKIPPSEVRITVAYLVDCRVCQEAVEPENGGFRTREEARDAKIRHLEEHARSSRKRSLVDEGLNPYLRYNG